MLTSAPITVPAPIQVSIADLDALADDGPLGHDHVPAQPGRSMHDRGGMGPGLPLRRGTK